MNLSIIVPVYNVEKHIRPCIDSLFRQYLDENIFEVIIVNDGTKKHSLEMIADMVQQHNILSAFPLIHGNLCDYITSIKKSII